MKLFLLFFILLVPIKSFACICNEPEGTEEEIASIRFNRADVVLFGEALEIQEIILFDNWFDKILYWFDKIVYRFENDVAMQGERTKFKVLKLYKGSAGEYVNTETFTEPLYCGVAFVKGRQYFLYLYKNSFGKLSATDCSGIQGGEGAIKESVIIDEITTKK